jgi:hypothetical protein
MDAQTAVGLVVAWRVLVGVVTAAWLLVIVSQMYFLWEDWK